MFAADFAVLHNWGQQVINRVGTSGLCSPDATRTVTWSTLSNMGSSIVDAPLVRVVLNKAGVGELLSLTDPIINFLDNNPQVLACMVTLNPLYVAEPSAFLRNLMPGLLV